MAGFARRFDAYAWGCKLTRVQPGRCAKCDTVPTICNTCGSYQCRCILPWILASLKGKKNHRRKPILIRVHYDHAGLPYREQFIDGYRDMGYPVGEEDLRSLIEEV